MPRIFWILVFVLSGCAIDVKDNDHTPEPQRVFDYSAAARSLGLEPPRALSGPHHFVHAGVKANDYRLELRLPDRPISLQRVDLVTGAVAIVGASNAHFVDVGAQPGGQYEYRLVTKGQNLTFRVEVPRDLDVQEPYFLPGGADVLKLQFRRVMIGAKGAIVTQGRNVEITTEELIAEPGAQIATFLKNTRAADGQPGRAGGLVSLNILNARGALLIDVSGENGGKGVDGSPHTERARGGEDLTVKDRPDCSTDFPQLGRKGENGVPGRPGAPAQPGGNSGTLNMKIGGQSEFRYSVSKLAGQGAPGGLGSEGQLGGIGGLSERHRSSDGRFCESKTPQRGEDGKQGPKAADGPPSGPGQDVGKICIVDLESPNCRDR